MDHYDLKHSTQEDIIEFEVLENISDEKKLRFKSKEKLVKAMRDAEITCESVYVSYFLRNTNIANHLRNLQFESLISGEYYPKRASEVFEAIFKQTLSHRLKSESISIVKDSSKQEERDELLAEMRDLSKIFLGK